MIVGFSISGCAQTSPAPSPAPTTPEPTQTAASYVGTDTCKSCHSEAHTGFTQTQHFRTFKPLTAYNIENLPQQITVFDADNTENPASASIDLSKAYGVMVDDYVIAQVPATAGFKSQTYRVAAVHKAGDKWTLAAAKPGDFNKDGTQDWGAAGYTCGTCHSPGLGVSEAEATIGCESCHGPGNTHVSGEKKGTMQVSQDACLTCHTSNPTKNKEGVWEANNHYGTRNYFASSHANNPALNDCLTCHTPHNVNKSGQTVIGDNPVADNCAKCHTEKWDLEKIMWKNPTDLRDHYTLDHSFGAMPYEKLGDKEGTKPTEITNPDMVKIIESKLGK